MIASKGALAEVSNRDGYLALYAKHVRSNTNLMAEMIKKEQGLGLSESQEAAEKFTTKIINCHAAYIDDYPERLKSALFNTVESGGSYPDAENAMKVAVVAAKSDGNDALVKQFIFVTEKTAECIKN